MSSPLDKLFRKASLRAQWGRRTQEGTVSQRPQPDVSPAEASIAPSHQQLDLSELDMVHALLAAQSNQDSLTGAFALIEYLRELCTAEAPDPVAISQTIRDLDDVLSILGTD